MLAVGQIVVQVGVSQRIHMFPRTLRIGFLHMDINVRDYVKYGIGRDQLTSSVSLDDETPDGCTVLLPGFNHNCREWFDRVRIEGRRPR